MKVKYQKAVISICLCLSMFYTVLGCGLLNRVGVGNRVLPVRSLTLTIDQGQREELFDQLQKFAAKHGFESRLTDFNTNGEYFQFWMSREDFIITASDVPPDPNLVYIFFYGKFPGVTVDEELTDELLTELKSFCQRNSERDDYGRKVILSDPFVLSQFGPKGFH